MQLRQGGLLYFISWSSPDYYGDSVLFLFSNGRKELFFVHDHNNILHTHVVNIVELSLRKAKLQEEV